jgi:hypothetical protein
MKVYIYWNGEIAQKLSVKIQHVLEELWLVDFIEVENTQNETLKNELGITQDGACIIEEESINFKDMIFEGILPEDEEIKAMFLSIIGGWESSWGSCGSGWWCGSGCSC